MLRCAAPRHIAAQKTIGRLTKRLESWCNLEFCDGMHGVCNTPSTAYILKNEPHPPGCGNAGEPQVKTTDSSCSLSTIVGNLAQIDAVEDRKTQTQNAP